jgi:hypothetical protein
MNHSKYLTLLEQNEEEKDFLKQIFQIEVEQKSFEFPESQIHNRCKT